MGNDLAVQGAGGDVVRHDVVDIDLAGVDGAGRDLVGREPHNLGVGDAAVRDLDGADGPGVNEPAVRGDEPGLELVGGDAPGRDFARRNGPGLDIIRRHRPGRDLARGHGPGPDAVRVYGVRRDLAEHHRAVLELSGVYRAVGHVLVVHRPAGQLPGLHRAINQLGPVDVPGQLPGRHLFPGQVDELAAQLYALHAAGQAVELDLVHLGQHVDVQRRVADAHGVVQVHALQVPVLGVFRGIPQGHEVHRKGNFGLIDARIVRKIGLGRLLKLVAGRIHVGAGGGFGLDLAALVQHIDMGRGVIADLGAVHPGGVPAHAQGLALGGLAHGVHPGHHRIGVDLAFHPQHILPVLNPHPAIHARVGQKGKIPIVPHQIPAEFGAEPVVRVQNGAHRVDPHPLGLPARADVGGGLKVVARNAAAQYAVQGGLTTHGPLGLVSGQIAHQVIEDVPGRHRDPAPFANHIAGAHLIDAEVLLPHTPGRGHLLDGVGIVPDVLLGDVFQGVFVDPSRSRGLFALAVGLGVFDFVAAGSLLDHGHPLQRLGQPGAASAAFLAVSPANILGRALFDLPVFHAGHDLPVLNLGQAAHRHRRL